MIKELEEIKVEWRVGEGRRKLSGGETRGVFIPTQKTRFFFKRKISQWESTKGSLYLGAVC
jgi:hypothetical protein